MRGCTSSPLLRFVLSSPACACLSFTSPSPSPHHSMLNWDELTFLRNNAITSMAASHYACMCVCHVCVCVRATVAQTLPGGKRGCSLLFLLLFQITVCFINVMVIWFPLPLCSLCLSKWGNARRTPIDLSSSRDLMPLSQFLPCQSFMNAAGGKWPFGNYNRQYA